MGNNHSIFSRPRPSLPRNPLFIKTTNQHRNAFRFLLILDQVSCPVFRHIFHFGASDRHDKETLKEYLKRKNGWSNRDYKDKFHGTFRKMIEKDPSGQSLDISCWLVVLKRACIGLADLSDEDTWVNSKTSLENHLKRIKDARNNTMHAALEVSDQQLYKNIESMRKLLLETLRLAQIKYSVPDTKMTPIMSEVNANINNIRDSPIDDLDLKAYERKHLFRALKNILETDGLQQLAEILEQLSHINAASLIIGKQIMLDVESIFSDLEIIDAGRTKTGTLIDHNELLSYLHNDMSQEDGSSLMKVALIEGLAGSGKTTVLKKMISDWNTGRTTGHYNMHELDKYDFIIPIECRSKSFSSLGRLVSSLMSDASRSFRTDDHLMEVLLDSPTLFLVDGMDEVNAESKKIMDEILTLKNRENVTLVCTTRPEKVRELYKMLPDSINTLHTYINGVPFGSMESFLSRYHEELKKKGASTQDTVGLIDYFRTRGSRLTEHWILPLNLSLLALLWACDPSRVNHISTPLDLLAQIEKLAIEKLLERLKHHEMTGNMDSNTLQEKVKEIVQYLCLEAMRGLRDDNLSLSDEALRQIDVKCQSLGLPSQEILGSFMVQKNSWSPTGMTVSVSYPHKTLQEYQGALYVYGVLFGITGNVFDLQGFLKSLQSLMAVYAVTPEESDKMIDSASNIFANRNPNTDSGKTILGTLQKIHLETSSPLSLDKYQNLLTLLIGILHLNQKDTDEELTGELVKLLRSSGIKSLNDWGRVINNVRCDDIVFQHISQIENTQNEKMDGIVNGNLEITDENVSVLYPLMKIKAPKEPVSIVLMRDLQRIPCIKEVLLLLTQLKSRVTYLILNDSFRRPTRYINLQHCIQSVIQTCMVNGGVQYTGHLIVSLNEDVLKTFPFLCVAIECDEEFMKLRRILKNNTVIQRLTVCISLSSSVTEEMLEPLLGVKYQDGNSNVFLYLSDVDEEKGIKKAVNIMKKLKPTNGTKCFREVFFPRCNLQTPEGIEKLFKEMEEKLQKGDVQVYLTLPSRLKPTSEERRKQLEETATKTLGIKNGIIWGRHQSVPPYTLADLDGWE